MSFTTEPLSPTLPFGTTIRGLTAEHIRDDTVRLQLRSVWTETALIKFCDGEMTEQFHLDLSRVFGPLEIHPTREFRDEQTPELLKLSSSADTTEVEVDGERGGQFQSWHKDSIYLEKVNLGGVLRAVKPTNRGGLTGFIDLADAYDRLPQALVQRIDGLRVVYSLSLQDAHPYTTGERIRVFKKSDALTTLFARRDRDYPPVSHPLVFTQPTSGRKILNFSPSHAKYIEGMAPEESHALLTLIAKHLYECPAYHHRWSTAEMLLWDNWRMVHRVSLQTLDEERIMQRTTIAGDYGLGRKATLQHNACTRSDSIGGALISTQT
jgi:taurine dioxygenase